MKSKGWTERHEGRLERDIDIGDYGTYREAGRQISFACGAEDWTRRRPATDSRRH